MTKATFTAALLASCVALGFSATGAQAADAGAFIENTTVGGTMFFDFTNINQKVNGVSQPTNGSNVDVKRFYLTAAHEFDKVWSANLTTDFNYVSNDSQTQLYVKKAYLQAKFSDAFVARVGSSDTPWVPFVEKVYGYRFIEQVVVDRTKYGTSTDWGVHAGGKLANGMVEYAVSALNGAGYKKLTRSKSVDFEGRISFTPLAGITLGAGGYTGKLGQNVEGAAPRHTAQRATALVAYSNAMFRIGGEYFYAKNWGAPLASVADDSSEGFSAFGSFNVTPELAVFGRYDHVKPKRVSAPSLKENYFNVGAIYNVRKNIDIALVYKRDKAENGTISTGNGTIGGSVDGTYDEFGLFGMVKF